MSMKQNVSSIFLLVAMSAATSCADPGNGSSAGPSPEVDGLAKDALSGTSHLNPLGGEAALAQSDLIAVPPAYQFKHATIRSTSTSWADVLASAPVDERLYLEKVNSSYFGVLGFETLDELRKLARQGFPLPQEWLEARRMTDDELKGLAAGGNVKAEMLYSDRLIGRALEYLPLRESDPAAYDNGPGSQAAILAYAKVGKLKASTNSPFAAYQDGYMQYSLNTARSPEFVAGAMFSASERGDARAEKFLQEFRKTHPDMDAGLIMSVYTSLKPKSPQI